MATDIEKKSLEAHVELCAERYSKLENKLENLENRIDKIESHLVDIKDSLVGSQNDHYKMLVTIGTTVMGALIGGLIALLIHLSK